MGFAEDIRRSVDLIKLDINNEVFERVKFLTESLIKHSPIQPTAYWSKGLFVNNWFFYYGVSSGDDTTVATDSSGSGSMNRFMALPRDLFYEKDNVITIKNNLQYAANVESFGWAKTSAYQPITFSKLDYIGKYSMGVW